MDYLGHCDIHKDSE